MRIHVKTSEKDIRLLFPTCFVMNGLTAHIGAHYIRKQNGNFAGLGKKELLTLFREIRRLKKKHPDWCLAEIRDAKHKYIKINL